MIFVTLGNLTQPFPRLVSAVDDAAFEGLFGDEEVVIQAGSSMSVPTRLCRMVRVLSPSDFLDAIRRASLVICHCGAGSVFHALRAGHVPVVMPRLPIYNESVEDQTDFMFGLERQQRVVGLYGPRTLAFCVTKARALSQVPVPSGQKRIVTLVGAAIDELQRRRKCLS